MLGHILTILIGSGRPSRRSVTTVSDVESDELELYLAQFDSLLLRHGCTSPSTGSQSSGYHR